MHGLEKAKQMLVDRRRTLEKRLPDQLIETREARGAQPAIEDESVDREIVDRLSALTAAEQHEVAEIDAALNRIETETYGQCERCGSAIGRGRLQALPETRFCIECSDQARKGNA